MSKEEINGYKVTLAQDNMGSSPDEWGDQAVFLVAEHRQFHVDRDGYSVHSDEATRGEWEECGFQVFPLAAHIHGGVVLQLGTPRGWDVGQVGWVLVKSDEFPDAEKAAESLLETWNQWLAGDVWWFQIEDNLGEVVTSLGGIYGEEYARAEAKAEAEALPVQVTGMLLFPDGSSLPAPPEVVQQMGAASAARITYVRNAEGGE